MINIIIRMESSILHDPDNNDKSCNLVCSIEDEYASIAPSIAHKVLKLLWDNNHTVDLENQFDDKTKLLIENNLSELRNCIVNYDCYSIFHIIDTLFPEAHITEIDISKIFVFSY